VEPEKRFLAVHAAGHDRVYRYLRRRTDAATAEDLCAEAFRIVWEKAVGGDSLSVLVLFGVAKNVLRNHHRSSLRSESLVSTLQRERPIDAVTAESPVLDALAKLSPDDREVLLLTYWDGLTSGEVSDLLNTSATAVRMRLHRARKSLSQLMQSQTEPEGAER
jgi:RNA polymerase sigma factor (sigma-70 family)